MIDSGNDGGVRRTHRWFLSLGIAAAVLVLGSIGLAACGDDDDEEATTAPEPSGEESPPADDDSSSDEAGGSEAPAAATGLPDNLPNALLLTYAQFEVQDGRVTANPGPARLEILKRQGGEWVVEAFEDTESNVFHKAMVYEPPGGSPGLITLGGMAAAVKLWRPGAEGWQSETLWTEEFGGRWNRMRDAEIADVYGDGRPDLAVGTHDQGVFAVLRPPAEQGGEWTVERIDRQDNTFIHEIEIGDLNQDGKLEVYATPSEPNTLEGGEQHGEVVRYIPAVGTDRSVVADLGNRHAKEIYVGDVDGDGRDELYVAVEALTEGSGQDVRIVEGVEIRRYEHDTPADQGVVIATINDRFTRFLTVGDFDGDGKKEMVAAGFRSGLWLIRPGREAQGEWAIESIDRDSSGFEHASLAADLDGDGTDELYVAADEQGEVRRYVWSDGRPRREVIHSRSIARSMMTWNITTAPLSVVTIGN